MSWEHCGVTIWDDDMSCPECGQAKEKWTVRLSKTRVFAIHNGWIELEILDASGEPLAGEPFRLEFPNGDVREGELDEDGFVRLERIKSDTCQLVFPGLDTDDLRYEDVEVPEVETAWIEILVQDEDGNPVADEEYRLEDAAGGVHEGTLDANGFVRLEGLDPDRCKLWLPNLEVDRDDVGHADVRPAEEEETSWVEIVLRDEAGQALADEKYCVRVEGETREGTTNTQGIARELDLPPGRADVWFPELDMREVSAS